MCSNRRYWNSISFNNWFRNRAAGTLVILYWQVKRGNGVKNTALLLIQILNKYQKGPTAKKTKTNVCVVERWLVSRRQPPNRVQVGQKNLQPDERVSQEPGIQSKGVDHWYKSKPKKYLCIATYRTKRATLRDPNEGQRDTQAFKKATKLPS